MRGAGHDGRRRRNYNASCPRCGRLHDDCVGTAIDLFAYPFGKPRVHFTTITMEVARLTGYRAAAAVGRMVAGPHSALGDEDRGAPGFRTMNRIDSLAMLDELACPLFVITAGFVKASRQIDRPLSVAVEVPSYVAHTRMNPIYFHRVQP
jgi:hypothetical protein